MIGCRRLSSVCVGIVLLAGTGCGGSGKPVPVQGVVTLDGSPLPRATVLFLHQDAGGRDANGFTDADGVFRLSTFKTDDGALPGKYKVIIQPVAEIEESPTDLKRPEDFQREGAKRVKVKQPAAALPAVYVSPDKTVLSQQVPPEGEVRFDLTSRP
jgi:hypothetical protein